jgi:DNA-binding response OmpR family regulator
LAQRYFTNLRDGESSGSTVLLVDTDLRVMHSYATALREAGFAVLEAVSFEDGRRLWRSTWPDVLVVDVRLGQFNGLQLLMRARADRADVHAIITCPFPDAVLEAETRRFGATFLTKPLHPWQIVEAVRTASQSNGAGAAVPAAPTPPLLERRRGERRVSLTPDFHPERRGSDRRQPRTPQDRRAADRRQVVDADFTPERRQGDRRIAPRPT